MLTKKQRGSLTQCLITSITLIFATAITPIASATSDSFCGALGDTNEAGLYIWRDCNLVNNREQWFMRIVTVDDYHPFSGSINSQWKIRNLVTVTEDQSEHSFEAGDEANFRNGGDADNDLDYALGAGGSNFDQISFTIHMGSPNSSLDFDNNGLPVFAGPNNIAVDLDSILDLDLPLTPLPEISVSDVVANESDEEVSFVVQLSNSTDSDVSVNYATQNGTALSGEDYNQSSGVLTFQTGETSKTVTIELPNECVDEQPENFTLELSNAVGATLLDSSASATIDDNDYSNEELENAGFIVPDLDPAATDHTVVLRDALNAAILQNKNLYIPYSETPWIVSDTILGAQPVTPNGSAFSKDRRQASSIIGASCSGQRPTIKLVPKDDRFDKTTNEYTDNDEFANNIRRPVLWLYGERELLDGSNSFQANAEAGPDKGPQHNQPNVSFNQVIRGINFDLTSPGTSEAIAIRNNGSQGSSISDVKVELGYNNNASFSAFDNPPGQGGGLLNVEVIGGKYAVTTNPDVRFPVIVGAKFHHQSIAAIQFDAETNLVMTGFDIISITGGNAVEISNRNAQSPGFNNINLVDGRIMLMGVGENFLGETIDKPAINNPTNKSISLHNVFIRGLNSNAQNFEVLSNLPDVIATFPQFLSAQEYINGGSGQFVQGEPNNARLLENGTLMTSNWTHGSIASSPGPNASALIENHVSSDANFPSFDGEGIFSALNTRDSNGNNFITTSLDAAGNPFIDTSNLSKATRFTNELQAMLNVKGKVFLPAGDHRITGPIRLNKDNVLIGSGKQSTSLVAIADEQNQRWERGAPIIDTADMTVDEANSSKTVLAHIALRSAGGTGSDAQRRNSFIDWKAGENSIVRDISIATEDFQGSHGAGGNTNTDTGSNDDVSNQAAVLISETGGGRWYGFHGEWTRLRFNTDQDDYHAIEVSNTSNPLSFYALNVERVRSEPQISLENANNVSFYSLKAEANVFNGSNIEQNDIIHINDSDNVRLVSLIGNYSPNSGSSALRVSNSSNIKALNIRSVIRNNQESYDAIDDVNNNRAIPGNFNAYLIQN